MTTGFDNETITGDSGEVAMTDDNPLGLGDDAAALLDDAAVPQSGKAGRRSKGTNSSGKSSSAVRSGR